MRAAGIELCGGGMGETVRDRGEMPQVLAAMDLHPESVLINALVAFEGTPLGNRPPIDPFELVGMVATAQLVMRASVMRLSAGIRA